ncbi:MAG: Methyltransferase type 11 [Edaphobacter sp.]|nr:Methyltransferase type 11 [Edaphobacter sp.]
MAESTIVAQFADVFRMSPQEVTEKIDRDFNRYYQRYLAGEPFDPYINKAQAVVAETGWSGSILDVGCGFGVFAICLRASGVDSVTGTDVIPEKITGASRLVELMGIQNMEFTVATGEQLPFSDAVFDGVLMKDTASHLPANTRCYAEVLRVLRPGGSLLIVDDRNILNPWTRWRTKTLWRRTDFGSPQQAARLGLKCNLSELRLGYIKDHFPELSDQESHTLAIETRGLLNSQIAEFIAARRGGSKPPQRLAECINPENGMVQERLLNPFRLAHELQAMGFQTNMLPPLDWRAESSPLRSFGQMLWPIPIMSTAHFQVLATRPH